MSTFELMETGPQEHSTPYLAGRILAAIAVIGAAIALEGPLLSNEVAALRTFDAKIREVAVRSERIGRALPTKVVVPTGAQDGGARSLVIFLHERGGDEDSHVDQELLRALDQAGADAPIVAFPRGGADSYWHDREEGAWGSYVLEEVVPRLRRRLDIPRDQVVLAGISMGGYGAYNIARQAPRKFCAVAGHAPAIWESFDRTAPGAFDDAEDFSRNDVIEEIGMGSKLDGKRAWIDVGTDDPFAEANRELLDSLDAADARTSRRLEWPGGHETSYWTGNWQPYVNFYARALKECAGGG